MASRCVRRVFSGWLLLAFGLDALGATSPRQTVPCIEVFKALADQGLDPLYGRGRPLGRTEVDRELGFLRLAGDAKVFHLGVGGSGDVYRVVVSPRTSYVVKKFHRGEGDIEPADRLAKEKARMDAMREASTRSPRDTLEIVSVSRVWTKDSAMKLEDVKGYPLPQVARVLRATGDASGLATLQKEFNRRLASFVEDMKASGKFTDLRKVEPGTLDNFEFPGFDQYVGKTAAGEYVDFGDIGNVVFEPQSGRFVIVDPF